MGHGRETKTQVNTTKVRQTHMDTHGYIILNLKSDIYVRLFSKF